MNTETDPTPVKPLYLRVLNMPDVHGQENRIAFRKIIRECTLDPAKFPQRIRQAIQSRDWGRFQLARHRMWTSLAVPANFSNALNTIFDAMTGMSPEVAEFVVELYTSSEAEPEERVAVASITPLPTAPTPHLGEPGTQFPILLEITRLLTDE
jgi:hypothetical protein